MKNRKLFLVLVLAITTGMVAAYLAMGYLRDQARSLVAAEPPKGRVVVATRALGFGQVVRAEDVRLVDWPGQALPTGYASTAAEVIGRGLITPLQPNEPVLSSKLAPQEAGGGLPVIIPAGMRAVSVRVDEVVGVAGFVLPGTRVDVLVTLDIPNQQRQAITRVILQNVQTLAAGQTVQPDADGKPQSVTVITLLVTPEQAEQLALAANEGRVQLALRNMLDLAETQTRGVRTEALINGAPTGPATRAVRAPARTAPQATVIETYRGGVRTLSTFSQGAQ